MVPQRPGAPVPPSSYIGGAASFDIPFANACAWVVTGLAFGIYQPLLDLAAAIVHAQRLRLQIDLNLLGSTGTR